MNVTNKTTKTFSISEITEPQAQDIFNVVTNDDLKNRLSDSENETFNSLRQALLTAGLTRGEHAN